MPGFTTAAMVDEAVRSYLYALTTLIEQGETPDLPALPLDHAAGTVYLPGDVVFDLDRVVERLATVGLGDATRGSLVSDAVRAYLRGFRTELGRGD